MNLGSANQLNNSTIDESLFHRLSDSALKELCAALERADENGMLEMEYAGGVIAINLPSGRQYIVNKHTASKQLWLSSPRSGGLHFSYHDGWKLADGRVLRDVLLTELEAETGEILT